MRFTCSLLIIISLALTLAACGSSSEEDKQATTLSSTQIEQLKKRADAFALNMNKVAEGAKTCGQKAKSSDDISTCLAEILTNASKEMTGIVDYTTKVSQSVGGNCRIQLKSFSTALSEARDGFDAAAKSAQQKNLTQLEKDLSTIDSSKISSIGKKVDASCN